MTKGLNCEWFDPIRLDVLQVFAGVFTGAEGNKFLPKCSSVESFAAAVGDALKSFTKAAASNEFPGLRQPVEEIILGVIDVLQEFRCLGTFSTYGETLNGKINCVSKNLIQRKSTESLVKSKPAIDASRNSDTSGILMEWHFFKAVFAQAI